MTHAIRAQGIQAQLDELRLQAARLRAGGPMGNAGFEGITELQEAMAALEQELGNELETARGVVSFATLEITEPAAPPDRPSTRGIGQFVLAGSGIGLLLGALAAILMDLSSGDRAGDWEAKS